MLLKYRNSNNIYGTFELNDDGELVDYELHVPINIPLIPVPITLTNLHTITLKSRGVNRMKEIVEEVSLPIIEVHKSMTKYDLVKYVLQVDPVQLDQLHQDN